MTEWFVRSSTFPEAANVIALRTLKASESSNSNEWDWLPTTRIMVDPIHRPSLTTIAKQSGRYSDYSIIVAEVYKLTLASLRKPAAFGIDFGITPDSKTLLVEVNDGRSLGNYGLAPQVYALFLQARWDEMATAQP